MDHLQQSAPGYASLSYTDDAYGSSSMRRTLSELTDHSNRSTDSNHTHWSAGEYPSQTSPVSAGGEQPSFDYSIPSYAALYGTSQDSENLFDSIGSQYQDIEESTPDSLPFQLLESRAGDEAAALQVTQIAQEQLVSDAYRKPSFTIVTFDAVDSALKHLRKRVASCSDREAVQDVLWRYLSRQLNDANHNRENVNTALQEAACQLQLRVQGEEAYNICYYAIAAVLADLREPLPDESFETQDQGGPSPMGQYVGSLSISLYMNIQLTCQ